MRDACPLMIFAAGFGTRMGALTADRPKPMLEVGGRRLIDRAIDLGDSAGCAPIVANTHYLSEVIAPVLAARGVAVSHETPDILDTGGGLRAALPLLGGGCVVTMNPDVAWSGPNPIRTLLDTPWPPEAGALLLLVPEARARARNGPGDFAMDEDGRVARKGPFVYSGTQIIDTGALGAIRDRVFSLNAVWTALAAEGRLFGCVYPGLWCDVGHPDGLAEADRLLGGSA